MASRQHIESREVNAAAASLVSILCALVAWALASPVGSSPDEDFHIANIYCKADSSSCRSDDETPPQFLDNRELPCLVRNGTTWYAPDTSVPADCLDAEDPANNTPGSADNLSYYPSVNYTILSLFVSDTIRKSVVVWRLVNIAIALCMAACSLRLMRPADRFP